MRTRTLLAAALVGVVAAGSAAPTLAAPRPKPKPKPIVVTYKASATPDPSSTTPVNGICKANIPTGVHKRSFTVPAAGTLEVKAANKLDWALALRAGSETLSDSDGSSPQDVEQVSANFKKKTVISIDACNFAGEPEISITYKFTYK